MAPWIVLRTANNVPFVCIDIVDLAALNKGNLLLSA
jgi:hypothetical protein